MGCVSSLSGSKKDRTESPPSPSPQHDDDDGGVVVAEAALSRAIEEQLQAESLASVAATAFGAGAAHVRSDHVVCYLFAWLDPCTHKRFSATNRRMQAIGRSAWTWRHTLSVHLWGMNAGPCDWRSAEVMARRNFVVGDDRQTKILALLEMERCDWRSTVAQTAAFAASQLRRLTHVVVTVAPCAVEHYIAYRLDTWPAYARFATMPNSLVASELVQNLDDVARRQLRLLDDVGHAGVSYCLNSFHPWHAVPRRAFSTKLSLALVRHVNRSRFPPTVFQTAYQIREALVRLAIVYFKAAAKQGHVQSIAVLADSQLRVVTETAARIRGMLHPRRRR